MENLITTLETVIDLVRDSAADIEDLREVMELLYSKADELDAKIVQIEEDEY